jgi:SAM-dependent methyltransferase
MNAGVLSLPMGESSFVSQTRLAYDTVASTYADRVRTELSDRPLDRALLTAFAELVLNAGGTTVADIGCGPGSESDYLRRAGLDVWGLDLSSAMVAQAHRLHPDLSFGQASMMALPFVPGVLGGILAWYSTIHVPTDHLATVFAEFHRVLRPGGYVLLGFQVGDERVQLDQAYGHAVAVVAYRRSPEQIAELLETAALPCVVRAVRQPDPDEKVPQGYLLARKAAGEPS